MENGTIYAYKLQHIDNPTFDNVQRLARTFINDLPQPMVDEIYEDLNRGVDQLTTEPQMLVYLHSFGSMHQAKLRYAFNQLPDAFREQPKVNIIDYGCGQAIGTMCYADFLRENGIEQNIGSITLIEPSEICLRRAALHAQAFFPEAEIRTICKGFDDLSVDDILCDESTPTLHILSNVLDIQEFDLEDFASLITDNLNNYNQFVCVGPYFSYSDKDERMTQFAEMLNGNISYSKIFEKGELCAGKTWTAQIVCFSVGELEEELSTEVTDEEIENGIEGEVITIKGNSIDLGYIYSRDYKRFLKCKSLLDIADYKIKSGTKIICDYAFMDKEMLAVIIPDSVVSIGSLAFANCKSLQQITIPESVTNIGYNPFSRCENLALKSKSNRFIIQNGLLIDTKKNNIISYVGENDSVIIPDSITSIGGGAFAYCKTLRQISIPDSVTNIEFGAFIGCKMLNQITIPDSVTSIGDGAFDMCDSLQQIIIPVSCEKNIRICCLINIRT